MKFEVYMCQLLLTLCTISEIVSTHNSYVFDYGQFRQGKRMKASKVFMTVHRPTLIRCIKECARYKRCGAITFSSANSMCELGTARSPVYPVSDQDTMTSPHSWNLPQEIVGNCANHNCSEEEKCMDFTNRPVQCETVECPSYTGTTHSLITTSGARSIGMEFPIVCPSGFYPTINMTTCGRDGNWTVLDNVHCLNCTLPFYENHILISCYNYPSLVKKTYAAAKNVCETIGGKIPRIDSELRDSYFRTVKDGFYWIEGTTETDAESMHYDDGTFITYKNYEISNTSMCGQNVTECVTNTTNCKANVTESGTINATMCGTDVTNCWLNATKLETNTTDCGINATACETNATDCGPNATACRFVYTAQCLVDVTTCEERIPKCGISMSSFANDNQMFIRDKITEPQLAVCEMVLG